MSGSPRNPKPLTLFARLAAASGGRKASARETLKDPASATHVEAPQRNRTQGLPETPVRSTNPPLTPKTGPISSSIPSSPTSSSSSEGTSEGEEGIEDMAVPGGCGLTDDLDLEPALAKDVSAPVTGTTDQEDLAATEVLSPTEDLMPPPPRPSVPPPDINPPVHLSPVLDEKGYFFCTRVPPPSTMVRSLDDPDLTRTPEKIVADDRSERYFERFSAHQFDEDLQQVHWKQVPILVLEIALRLGVKWKFTVFRGFLYWQPGLHLTTDRMSTMVAELMEAEMPEHPSSGANGSQSFSWDGDGRPASGPASSAGKMSQPPLDPFEREYQPSVTGSQTPLNHPAAEGTPAPPEVPTNPRLSCHAGQDATELREKLIRHLREPKSTDDDLGQTLVVKEGERLATTDDGTPVQAPLAGSYTTRIWRITSDGFKVLVQPCRILEVLPRACQLWLPQDDYKKTFKGMQDRLPVHVLGPEEKVPRVYVGVSSLTAQPVYMQPRINRGGTMDYQDNFRKVDLKMEPSRKIAGSYTILHEACLVAGNLGQLKRLVVDNNRSFPSEPSLMEKMAYQNKRALEFLPVEPLAATFPRKRGSERPDMAHFYRAKLGLDALYEHTIPPLGVLDPPGELIVRLYQFLSRYGRDPMPLNLALQAVIVYLDIQDAFERKVEEGVREPEGVRHPIPEVSPEVFVLYYPHWLRFHEVNKLTRYIHPVRFIHRAYQTDVHVDLEKFNIEKGTLQIGRMRELVGAVTSKAHNISPKVRIPVIPASMPGTTMLWPARVRRGEPPCDGLFALCLLDDIQTIGIPSYYLRTRSRLVEMVAIPDDLARERNVETPTAHHYAPHRPPRYFWEPCQKAALVSIAGPSQTVGPVFKPLEGTRRVIATDSVPAVFYPFSHPGSDQLIDWSSFLSPQALARIAETNDKRLTLATKLGKTAADLLFDPVTLSVKWEGSHSDLVQAAIDRQLPVPCPAQLDGFASDSEVGSLAGDDEDDLEVTLPITDPDMLSGSAIDEITSLIGNCDIRALDWDGVMEAMRNPAMKRNVTQALRRIWVFLLKDLSTTREALRDPGKLDNSSKLAIAQAFPLHVLRTVGALSSDLVGSVDIFQHWGEYASRFPSGTLHDTFEQVEMLAPRLTSLSSWKFVEVAAGAFYGSPACADQLELLQRLETLLSVEVRQEEPSTPPPEVDLYSADG